MSLRDRVAAWAPAVVWALVIFSMSTEEMSAARTASLLDCGWDSLGAALAARLASWRTYL